MKTAVPALAVALTVLPLASGRAMADDAAILAAAAKRWAAAAELHKQLDKLLATERESVVKLVGESGVTDALRALAGTVVPPALDALAGKPDAADAAEAERKLATWRRSWGPKWGKLVKLAGKLGRGDYAHRFARLALLRDTDQADARALLGLVKLQGEWLGSLAAAKARAGQVWSHEAGWVARGDLSRIAAGELPFEARWLPKGEVLAKRAIWQHAWTFEWGCWRVRSTVAPAEWASLRDLLDVTTYQFRHQWGHLFDVSDRTQIQVLVFASVEDFRAHVDEFHQGDPGYRGRPAFYEQSDNAVHLAWNSERAITNRWNVVHEATHGLLGAGTASDDSVNAVQPEIFLEEAVAVLAEDLLVRTEADSAQSEPGWPGLYAAQLTREARLSLRALLALHAKSYPDALRLYTHASGVGRFLYASPDPHRFEALKEYVALLHKNQAHPDLFPKLCGTTWEQLEAEWNAFCDELVKNPNHGKPEPLKWPK